MKLKIVKEKLKMYETPDTKNAVVQVWVYSIKINALILKRKPFTFSKSQCALLHYCLRCLASFASSDMLERE